MGKMDKNNRGKVPKITEAEYAAYVNRLRELSEREESQEVNGAIQSKEVDTSLP